MQLKETIEVYEVSSGTGDIIEVPGVKVIPAEAERVSLFRGIEPLRVFYPRLEGKPLTEEEISKLSHVQQIFARDIKTGCGD